MLASLLYTSKTRFPESKQAQTHANRHHSPILTKTKRYFSAVWDVSRFKLSSNSNIRAKRSALVFQRRNKPRHKQIAIIRRFCRKISIVSLPFEIFRRLNAVFTALCVRNVVHAISSVETSSNTWKSQSFADIVNFNRYFSLVWDISTFKRSFHSSLHALRGTRVFQHRSKPRHTQIAIIPRFWRKYWVLSLPFERIRRINARLTPIHL